MLGTRLRSWMEAHLGRPKKRQRKPARETRLAPPTPPPVPPPTQPPPTHVEEAWGGPLRVTREPLRTAEAGPGERVNGAHNLSSPESAYSTGYSTDGTSPGASLPPPEYYVHHRTGKHYLEAECGQEPVVAPQPATPRRTRRPRPLPESSTEEDIADRRPPKPTTPKGQRGWTGAHRRADSYDGGAPSPLPGASPRQRTRIRTNPWHPPPPSQDEAPWGVDDSSSTLSSSDKVVTRSPREVRSPRREARSPRGDHRSPRAELHSPRAELHSPRADLRSPRVDPRSPRTDLRSPRPLHPPLHSPVVSGRVVDAVTVCSPRCLHVRPPRAPPLSSSSSGPSSGSDRPDPTDSSDPDDDATMNEILGNSSELSNEPHLELDFIDNGSLMEQISDSSEQRKGKMINKGHCTYHGPEGEVRPGSKTSRRGRSGDASGASSRASSHARRPRRSLRDKELNTEVVRSARPGEGMPREGALNLNRVLMERLINSNNGSRSADTTPVMRRHGPPDYNGKYLRNPHVTKLITSSVEPERRASLQQDPEGDMRCRRLIREAQTFLELRPYPSPTLSTRSAVLPSELPRANLNEHIRSQINLLEKMNNNVPDPGPDDGILKTISKTLERMIPKKGKKEGHYVRSNSFVGLPPGFPSPSLRRTPSEPRPKPRGIDVIRNLDPPFILPPPPPPLESPIEFKAFDLGPQASLYCPQSEPVKRKVYAGSATLGKLHKSLMRKESEKLTVVDMTTENLREENANLKERVEQLRKQRLKVEARVKEAQTQIDRLNFVETSSRC